MRENIFVNALIYLEICNESDWLLRVGIFKVLNLFRMLCWWTWWCLFLIIRIVIKWSLSSCFWGDCFPTKHSDPNMSFPLSALSVHRKSVVHFEKTIIPGHLSWVKTIVYCFNSLFYWSITVCADQPAACLPGCRILKPQYTALSPPLPIFPAEPANPMYCLCCLLS